MTGLLTKVKSDIVLSPAVDHMISTDRSVNGSMKRSVRSDLEGNW